VDKIVGYETRDDKEFYKVRWKGYKASDDTWEPRNHLSNATDLIAAFEEQWNRQNPRDPFIH
jgi:hypothetical protein